MLRRICLLICAFGIIAMGASAPAQDGGSGPYPAIIEGDPGLPVHTIYRPGDLSPFSREHAMPVLAWGNGGCANSSAMHANFLEEIASHGFLVLAIGPFTPEEPPGRGGMGAIGGGTKSDQLLEALDWAAAENGRSGGRYYGKVDLSKFSVAGMSCGGLQALEVAPDPRVKTTLVMNSGLFGPGGRPKMGPAKKVMPEAQGKTLQGKMPQGGGLPGMPTVGKEVLAKLHSPTIYIIGGESDMAYPQAIDDYAKIDKVPVAMANLDVGHGGTYSQPNGGEFGKVAVAWLKWQLKGDKEAG